MPMPTTAHRSMAAAILVLVVASAAALAKDVPNSGTARPAPPLSPAQRAALATKDAVRRAQEAQLRQPAPAAKPGALMFVGPERPADPSRPVALKLAAPSRAPAPAAMTGAMTGAPDEATLEMLRALMGPERAAAFGIAKAAPPSTAVRPAPATPAKDAHR
jgi:hypothetical protein